MASITSPQQSRITCETHLSKNKDLLVVINQSDGEEMKIGAQTIESNRHPFNS